MQVSMYPEVMSPPIVEMESFKYMKYIIVLICQMVLLRFCDNLTFGHTLLILPLEPGSTPQAVTVSATSSKSIFVSWDPVIALLSLSGIIIIVIMIVNNLHHPNSD